MNAPDYLGRLREKNQSKMPIEGTAQTAKTTLRSLCSSPLAHKSLISSSRWLIHFADRNPMEVAFSPAVSHAEVLAIYPDALAAEPAVEVRQPGGPLTGDHEAIVRAWLAQIGEVDVDVVGDVLERCRQDDDVRQYFLDRAGEGITADTDDQRRCDQCGSLRSGVCVVAKPGGVVSAICGYRPVSGILKRCLAFVPARQPANSL